MRNPRPWWTPKLAAKWSSRCRSIDTNIFHTRVDIAGKICRHEDVVEATKGVAAAAWSTEKDRREATAMKELGCFVGLEEDDLYQLGRGELQCYCALHSPTTCSLVGCTNCWCCA